VKISETDEAVLAVCNRNDGAIEDAEVFETEVRYFFESGAVGIVDRVTGAVTIKRQRKQPTL
jgi:preprotein translocase subunit SecA